MKTTALLLLLFTGAVSCVLADTPDHFQDSPLVWRQLRGVDGPAVRAACAALGGRLYLLGGARRGVHGDLVPSNKLQERDVAAGRWETLAPCPVSVWVTTRSFALLLGTSSAGVVDTLLEGVAAPLHPTRTAERVTGTRNGQGLRIIVFLRAGVCRGMSFKKGVSL